MVRELLRRRVPQIVGGYLATSWVLLEFTDWAVGQYALSPALTNLVVTALLFLLPAVAILAWRHGAPGEDGWTRMDAAVIGLNVIVAGGILWLSFGGEQLGAVAFAGDESQNWLILKDGHATIGLFAGMFDRNILTFNPGWSQEAEPLSTFVDVREIQRRLKEQGIEVVQEADEDCSGPASMVVIDPDGNQILIDQHI